MPDLLITTFDLVAVTILAYGIYFRRHRRRDMALAYLVLNVGVMGVTAVMTSATVGAGVGIGLFGILSIIRLRSSEITHEEVAYYFVALALGLLCGFQPEPRALAPLLGGALLAVLFVADHPRLQARARHQVVTLDAAYPDERALVARLEDLLGADVHHVVVTHLDLVRDLTVVDVRYSLRDLRGVAATRVADGRHDVVGVRP